MRSIRNHLLIWLTGGVLVLTAAAGTGVFVYMDEVLEHGLDTALAAKAEAICGAVHMEDDGQPHLRNADTASPTSVHHDGPFYFEIRRADGGILAQSLPPGSTTKSLRMPDGFRRSFHDAPLPNGADGRMTQLSFTALPDEDEFDPPKAPTTRRSETLTLTVAHDRRSIDQTLAVLFTALIVTAAIVAGGILVIVTFGVRRGLLPLKRFAGLSDRIGPDSLDVRFPTDELPAELAPVGRKFNEVLDRLSAGFARERMFTAAAAHELRTPLAELRTICEVTLRWPDDAGATAKALAESLAIATEMSGRVQSLMSLARCQSGVESPILQSVDLKATIDRLLARRESRIKERDLSVKTTWVDSTNVMAEPAMLSSILGNLISNAVEHSLSPGNIEIGSAIEENAVVLQIENSCQALTADDLPRMFDTFWTKSAHRHGNAHAGLGLALVAAQCKVIGATIVAELPRADWLVIRATFKKP